MELTVTEIISVTDTRQYIEKEGSNGDEFVPVPGTGETNICQRCGRTHEVHAQVRMSNDEIWIVGTGCMAVGNKELAKRFQAGDRAAKRLASLKAKLAAIETYAEKYDAVYNEVRLLPLPEVIHGEGFSERNLSATMGDATVYYWKSEGYTKDRPQCLVNSWRGKRMQERGFQSAPKGSTDLRKEIAKVKKRLKEINA